MGLIDWFPGKKDRQAPVETLDLEGIWDSNIGWVYDIRKAAHGFTWECATMEHGLITVTGEGLAASWHGHYPLWGAGWGAGAARGRIIRVEAPGRPAVIAWDNTVVFWRRPEQVKQRNPFGVVDIPDPDGADVQEFAARVKLAGDSEDPNALPWAPQVTEGDKGSLDGEWFGRWNFTGGPWVDCQGTAKLKSVGDRVYILYKDHQGTSLIDTIREQDRLVGRICGINNPAVTDPMTTCVFAIIGPDRLDGNWGGKGRIDFRRRLS